MGRVLRFSFWAAAVFAFVMAALPHPPQLPTAPTDKVQHMLAFVTLTLLGWAAYPRLGTVRLILCLSAFGALIEVVQMIPGLHRDADAVDWLVDTAAVIVVVLAISLWRRLRPPLSNSD